MRFICIIAFAVLATTANAATYGVWGYGNRSCGAWTADRQDAEIPWKQLVDLAWAEGFMSAMDHDHPTLNAASHTTDSDGLSAWMDNYCAAHPLDSIARALEMFAIELGRKR